VHGRADGQRVRGEAALALLIHAARRLGAPRLARQLPAAEIDAYAFATAYTLGARAWLARQRAPTWRTIERSWRSCLAAAGPHRLRAQLSGTLQPADTWQLLVDSGAAFDARYRLLRAAQRSVELSTYYFQADETGWRSAQALADCARRGVRVRVLVDHAMLAHKARETPRLDRLVRLLHDAGVEVRLWHDPRRPFDSNHRKLLLIDGRTALVGGRNFADHYRLGQWRDVDLLLSGPSVRPLGRLFETVWAATTTPAEQPPAPFAPWFDHTPSRLLHDATACWSLACIELAECTIDVELPYLVGPSLLTHCLVRAAQRGVRVRLLTNSAQSNDLPYTTYAAYAAMRHLLGGQVDVRARRGAGRTLHSKYLVVDGAWVSLGSHNLDYYSSRFCCETNLQVHSEALAAALEDCFADGLADSQPVDLAADVLPLLRGAHTLRLFNWLFKDFQ